MTRDAGLEALLAGDLSTLDGTRTVPMFGGLAWLWQGNLLCAARTDGVLIRLGKGNDGWALAETGISAMMMGARAMQGWVRLGPDAAGDDALRLKLLTAAKGFVATLPPKVANPAKG